MSHLISDSILRAIEQGILGLLLALGAACVLVFALRWRAVGLAIKGAGRWRGKLESALSGADDLSGTPPLQEAAGVAAKGAPAELASADRVARVGLGNSHLCADALEKLLETQEARERALLERGAAFLGTVGANAPFLGLTGTVLGILAAFRRMAEQGGSGGTEVMSAIAGALIATAAGLVVAIPAVVLYNLLKARVRKAMDSLREIRALLLARSLQAAANEVLGPNGLIVGKDAF